MPDFPMKFTFFFLSIFLCCLKISPAYLTTMPGHSLKPGDTLNSTARLCSAAKRFCLQFDDWNEGAFSYLVLNSQTDDDIWPPWLGNRDDPIIKNSGELFLDHSGGLKIASQGNVIKVLHSPIEPINNTKAILLDNGNFVLQQLHPNGSNSVLWQSFDYPTDVLLPGMKLGVNHKNSSTWSLISWKAKFDPSSGDFSLDWEPLGRELIIRKRGVITWKSGLLRNNGSFENIPDELRQRFAIVSNKDEDYINLTSSKSDDHISLWGLTYGGLLYDGKLGKYIGSKCFGFNNDGGCQQFDVPCWTDAEVVYGYVNFTDFYNAMNVTDSSFTREDCQRRCFNNCSCVGFFTIYDNDTGCTFLFENVSIITTIDPSDDNYRRIFRLKGPLRHQKGESNNGTPTDANSKDPAQMVKKGKRKWIWIGVVMATSSIILFILCVALRKRKLQIKEKNGEKPQTVIFDLLASNESTNVNELQNNITKGHELRIFSCVSIMEATNGFSSKNKLGEGGFGPVYKGLLPTGKEVAIKRLSKTSRQGVVEFKNELTLLCELQHMNLVQLLGCCIHEEERMLIYEFMPNKSLDFFLFDSTRSKLLDWQKRLNIIEGIAQGLLYLHKYSRLKIIHRDLKASNILLDENTNPKISDFGMARIFTQQESKLNTHRIVGT